MLQGKKTYIVALAFGLVAFAQNMGWISKELGDSLLLALGATGAATLSAKINRMAAKVIIVCGMLLSGSVLYAQDATPTSKFEFNQAAPALADAQAYTYKYYADGATTGVTFATVTCSGAASPYTCQVAVPAFTPGNHSIQLTATNAAGESAKSTPFNFKMVVTPATPTAIKIVQ